MVERCLVLVVRNREGVMDATMVVANGIDRRVALHEDPGPACDARRLALARWRRPARRDARSGGAAGAGGGDRSHRLSAGICGFHLHQLGWTTRPGTFL